MNTTENTAPQFRYRWTSIEETLSGCPHTGNGSCCEEFLEESSSCILEVLPAGHDNDDWDNDDWEEIDREGVVWVQDGVVLHDPVECEKWDEVEADLRKKNLGAHGLTADTKIESGER